MNQPGGAASAKVPNLGYAAQSNLTGPLTAGDLARLKGADVRAGELDEARSRNQWAIDTYTKLIRARPSASRVLRVVCSRDHVLLDVHQVSDELIWIGRVYVFDGIHPSDAGTAISPAQRTRRTLIGVVGLSDMLLKPRGGCPCDKESNQGFSDQWLREQAERKDLPITRRTIRYTERTT